MGASDRSNDHDQEQAAPAESVRRAGHTWGDAVGHVAREKGYKAASLRRAPWGRRLPGAASAPSSAPDCAPGRVFIGFHSCDPIERIQNIYKAAIGRV